MGAGRVKMADCIEGGVKVVRYILALFLESDTASNVDHLKTMRGDGNDAG